MPPTVNDMHYLIDFIYKYLLEDFRRQRRSVRDISLENSSWEIEHSTLSLVKDTLKAFDDFNIKQEKCMK